MTTTANKVRNPLFQQDIFLCILDCLTAPTERPHSTLVSLARTCHAFSEPSLDRLWRRLHSLEPLIRCFAKVLTEERAKMPPSPAEWAIIHRYSYRIKELEINEFSQFSMFFLRATSLYPSLLVPNLKALKWCAYGTSRVAALSIVFVQRLLSPSLISLDITLTDPEDGTLQSFLANYPIFCPNLKSISVNIDWKTVSHTIIEIFSQSITRHAHLEHLNTFTPLDDVALTHVTMSPRLKTLSLVLNPIISNLHRVRIPSDTLPFRNVRWISLEVWDPDFVIMLLRTQGQAFYSFKICYHSQPTTDAVSALFSVLASPQRTHSLESVSLLSMPRDVGRCHLTRDIFRPLASLCYLRHLTVNLGHWLSIDDGDLIYLARNWRLLRTLNLDCRSRQHRLGYPWKSAKCVTLKGLLSLLECCEDLEELSLPLDAREVPTDTGDIAYGPALKAVHFPESPIGDPGLVKEFFVRHIPFVFDISYSFDLSPEEDPEIQGYIASWAEIDANPYVPTFDDYDSDW